MAKKRFPSLADLFPRRKKRAPEETPPLAPQVDLGDLYPRFPHGLVPEPVPGAESAPSAASRALLDLGDLEPAKEPTREPEWPSAPGGAPSLASRERLDLGDLEPSPAEDLVPPAPERHANLEELSDSGSWYVEDLGEWEEIPRTAPWQKAPAERVRRTRRYGVRSIVYLPKDRPIPGRVMSYDEALRTAEELDRLRETMES